jgi:FixJ family two-component response regulator
MKPVRNGHVYLVDDNADIRIYLSDLLQTMGYSTQAYDSGQAFMHHSSELSPAVLVLDVRMPDMSGVELQEKLRSMGRQTPIIFISGECQSEEIIMAMKGLPVEFLWKPFPMQKLFEAIERGLSADRLQQDELIKANEIHQKLKSLTEREKNVFSLMLLGHTNKGISELMGILPDTVKKHRAHVLQKMQVSQLAELMVMCKGMDLSSTE